MTITLILIFVVGYLAIALEHPLKVDKAAVALILGMVLWIVYALGAEWFVPLGAGEKFAEFVNAHPSLAKESLGHQALRYILDVDIVEHLGDITQTLFFLIGAMTIVELVDVHGGFRIITDKITTRDKRKLLWIIAFTTFMMSAVLDNLTTTIVMIMLLSKLISDKHERWLYAGAIVIAANSGGAWSPIGDVTTIMLWVKGNVTAEALICYVLLPSIVSMVVPVALVTAKLKGSLAPVIADNDKTESQFSQGESNTMFFIGVGGLLFVPIFKAITHLPPFVGMLLVLGLLWVYTEIFYNRRKRLARFGKEYRLPQVIKRIDMPSILFFLGILMAVAVLQSAGVLAMLARALDESIHNVYIIDTILGVLSSIVDNVPLVAAAMGMYPIAEIGATGYDANFMVDGTFWELLSYCAGVGGSIMIIGSAAGVIAMGLEKISFGWYLKRFSWLALIGYLCGVGVYLAEHLIMGK
ncbi:MAG: sodium:proton antiporter NhaD [Clostridium sp.]|nr:sodium:proton antiporter NhaD [Prevotella sp.]MCM1429589.1 sodium:proton antiporter NhaD [Clostridium sp.]MCM1476068.1 sodium:proton antiporter NhaD [Muribaculaceae bacterium]